MKRCPECYEAYDDSERFCELDGQALLAEPTLAAPRVDNSPSGFVPPQIHPGESTSQREAWFIGTAGVVLGVVICVGGYVAYITWTADSGFKEPSAPAFTSQSQEPSQPSRQPAPRADMTPAVEEMAATEPEPSPEPPAAPPAEDKNAVAARLNQGPVSTGQRKKDADESSAVQTIIQMNDGTAVEVDAAWEDGQGVWYRRGGMVAFVESQRVKAITGRAAQKPVSGSTQ